MKKSLLLFTILLTCLVLQGYTGPLSWNYINNGRFYVYYPDKFYPYAKYALNNLVTYSDSIDTITGNSRKQDVIVTIEDAGEYYNGSDNPIANRLLFYNNTPRSNDDFIAQDWIKTLAIHEYTHQSHLTNAQNTPLILSKYMGNIFSPNVYSPMWIIEGITVRNESHFNEYQGRLNHGYYSEIVRAKARENKLPTPISANYYLDDYPWGNFYVYGGSFIKYLSDKYGEEKLTAFFNENGGRTFNILFGVVFPRLTLDRSAKKVFGKSFPSLFKEWRYSIKSSLNSYPTSSNYLKGIDWSNVIKVNNVISDDNGNLYFTLIKKKYSSYQYILVKYDTKNETSKILYESDMGLNANLVFDNNKLYFSESEQRYSGNNLMNSGYEEYSVIKCIDLLNGEVTRVFSDKFKNFEVLDNNKIFYTKENTNKMTSEIFLYDNGIIVKISSLPCLVSELKAYNDDLLLVYKDLGASWDIGILSKESDYTEIGPLINSPYAERNIQIHQKWIVFSSTKDNQFRSFRYNIETKKLEDISNGLYSDNPTVIANKLYFKNIHAKGERVSTFEINSKALPLSDFTIQQENDDLHISDRDYKPRNAMLKSLSELYKPYIRTPFVFMGQDGIGYFNYDLAWDWDADEGWSGSIGLTTKLLNPLILSFDIDNDDNTSMNISLPLYKSNLNLIKNVNLLVETDFREENYYGAQLYVKRRSFDSQTTYLYSHIDNGYYTSNESNIHLKNYKLFMRNTILNNYDTTTILYPENLNEDNNKRYYNLNIGTEFNVWDSYIESWTFNFALKHINLEFGYNYLNIEEEDSYSYLNAGFNTRMFMFNQLSFKTHYGLYINKADIEPYLKISTAF